MPYPRNSIGIAYDHDFWFHLCKMMLSPGVFFIFSKSWFSGLLGGGGKGQKNDPKWEKFCLSRSISQEPYIIWFSFMVLMFKMIISPRVLFSFSKLDFPGCYRVKGQKMAQNDKKFYLSHLLSQAPYIVWLLFMVHKCKMVIYLPVFFFIFSKFWVFGCQEGQRTKMVPNDKKLCLLHLMPSFMVHKDSISRCFLYLFQISIFGFNSGLKEQKMP